MFTQKKTPLLDKLLFPQCLPLLLETIPSSSSTQTCQRTDVKHTECSGSKAINTQLSPGELVALSPVFHVLVVQVPQDPAKVLSVTCAERVVCSLLLRHGESGTERSTRPRRDTPLLPLLLLQLLLPLSSQEATTSTTLPNSPLLLTPSTLIQPSPSFPPSTPLVPQAILLEFVPPSQPVLVSTN